MLGVNQLDFLNYTTAFKGNYRKGPHKLRAILSTPTQANEFCSNLGGVSVIFGVPLDHPDKNSEELLEILQGSPYNDLAVETWLHSFYEFETLDDLLNDAVTCKALANNALMFRAVGMGKVTVGKLICGLAGLDPASYEDIGTVVASDLAMAAVAGSQPAMAAAVKSPVAMTAMAGSAIAMAAVAKSQIAMTAVAASQTAMAAIIGNSSALNAVVSSSTAMAAIIGNSTALNAVVSSQTAMAAVGNSQTALNAIAASTTALNALYSKKKRMSGGSKSLSGKFIILEISADNVFSTSEYGYATLSDGSKPDWKNYKGKYAYFKQYKKVVTYMKNDTDSDDWIDYFQIA